MIKLFPYIVSIFLAFTSNYANSTELFSESMINKINDQLSDSTSSCDFEESTKYYFEGTKFYSYKIVDGTKTKVEDNYDEVIQSIKKAMKVCFLTLDKEETISEKITISNSGKTAEFISEANHFLKSKDGRRFKSHNKGKIVFTFMDGKVVIIESHYDGLSFTEIE